MIDVWRFAFNNEYQLTTQDGGESRMLQLNRQWPNLLRNLGLTFPSLKTRLFGVDFNVFFWMPIPVMRDFENVDPNRVFKKRWELCHSRFLTVQKEITHHNGGMLVGSSL